MATNPQHPTPEAPWTTEQEFERAPDGVYRSDKGHTWLKSDSYWMRLAPAHETGGWYTSYAMAEYALDCVDENGTDTTTLTAKLVPAHEAAAEVGGIEQEMLQCNSDWGKVAEKYEADLTKCRELLRRVNRDPYTVEAECYHCGKWKDDGKQHTEDCAYRQAAAYLATEATQ